MDAIKGAHVAVLDRLISLMLDVDDFFFDSLILLVYCDSLAGSNGHKGNRQKREEKSLFHRNFTPWTTGAIEKLQGEGRTVARRNLPDEQEPAHSATA
ncbi:MAG: hypothetical protein WCA00_19445 [Candidatus Acidiferrales bacterium]